MKLDICRCRKCAALNSVSSVTVKHCVGELQQVLPGIYDLPFNTGQLAHWLKQSYHTLLTRINDIRPVVLIAMTTDVSVCEQLFVKRLRSLLPACLLACYTCNPMLIVETEVRYLFSHHKDFILTERIKALVVPFYFSSAMEEAG